MEVAVREIAQDRQMFAEGRKEAITRIGINIHSAGIKGELVGCLDVEIKSCVSGPTNLRRVGIERVLSPISLFLFEWSRTPWCNDQTDRFFCTRKLWSLAKMCASSSLRNGSFLPSSWTPRAHVENSTVCASDVVGSFLNSSFTVLTLVGKLSVRSRPTIVTKRLLMKGGAVWNMCVLFDTQESLRMPWMWPSRRPAECTSSCST